MKTKTLKFLAAAVLLSASNVSMNTALAHGGAKPQHGGIVQNASDLSFELVSTGNGAAIYVIDHEKEFDTSRAGGRLTVLNGAEKSEAELKPAGGNKLEAKGVKLGKGAKVVAALTTVDKKTITVRFAVR